MIAIQQLHSASIAPEAIPGQTQWIIAYGDNQLAPSAHLWEAELWGGRSHRKVRVTFLSGDVKWYWQSVHGTVTCIDTESIALTGADPVIHFALLLKSYSCYYSNGIPGQEHFGFNAEFVPNSSAKARNIGIANDLPGYLRHIAIPSPQKAKEPHNIRECKDQSDNGNGIIPKKAADFIEHEVRRLAAPHLDAESEPDLEYYKDVLRLYYCFFLSSIFNLKKCFLTAPYASMEKKHDLYVIWKPKFRRLIDDFNGTRKLNLRWFKHFMHQLFTEYRQWGPNSCSNCCFAMSETGIRKASCFRVKAPELFERRMALMESAVVKGVAECEEGNQEKYKEYMRAIIPDSDFEDTSFDHHYVLPTKPVGTGGPVESPVKKHKAWGLKEWSAATKWDEYENRHRYRDFVRGRK